ncbi:DUF1573 domain-containing protein [Lutimonas zeaxanthinifaciens]|uniref:DUF1573 domain-containing protein n=1 Tax=Lutimonas zeaxanthinifaciens TaxID=3060215 RepID=UPI00265CD54E|nr:DUF1573 domain-containing protein [Lutimonas sp. YSD2104]WKK64974.1 DUF1573 domain-containing protein [Lutimonas sp. YSD2104]
MKKLLILLFIGVMSIPVNGQTEEDVKKDFTGPVFEFETKVIDYGEIAANSDGNRVFKFKNIGKSPLIISKVKGSCGCTVPTKPEEPIMPGETGEIGVKYATNRIGPFSKTITISSNAYEPQVVLKIKGRVLEQGSGDLQKKKAIVSESN